MSFEEIRRHVCGDGKFADILTEDLRAKIREYLPAYLWIASEDGGTRVVSCDGCGGEWQDEKYRGRWGIPCEQNREVACPACGGRAYIKSLNRGHGFRDRINVVWYKKSEIEPGVIVAIAAHCIRDYDNPWPWQTQTDIQWRGTALFRYGDGSSRWQEKPAASWFDGNWHYDFEWREIKRMENMTFGTGTIGIFRAQSPVDRCVLTDTLELAIEGTPFERAWHRDYLLLREGQDGTKALDMIARYPCIEYLTKLGMQEFLEARLGDDLPDKLINWRGKSMEKVLKLSRQRLGELKAMKITPHPRLCALLRYFDKEKLRVTTRDAAALAWLLESVPVKSCAEAIDLALCLHPLNRRLKAVKYMAKMARRDVEAGVRTFRLTDVRDYWHQCELLGTNMYDDREVFPGDLHAQHGEYTRRIQHMRNAEKDEQIAENIERFTDAFAFEFGGLILRPAQDSAEVIREGQTLSHCVGGYVDRYAAGKTVICVLRRAVEPDAPWRTVEITPDGRVVQDRGYRNDGAAGIVVDEKYRMLLDMFWTAWRERSKKQWSAQRLRVS